MPYQADFTIWLNPNSKHKTQGWFLSSPSIFTKPNFEGVISFPSTRENFSFSLRFRFDYRLEKKGRGAAPTKILTQHQGGPPSGKYVKKINSIHVKKTKLFDER